MSLSPRPFANPKSRTPKYCFRPAGLGGTTLVQDAPKRRRVGQLEANDCVGE
jgi:hypothetical protein